MPDFKSRKTISRSGRITVDGEVYAINSGERRPVYSEIARRTIEQLNVCQSRWGRVLVVRFDLHQQFYSKDSKLISRFWKNLARRLERAYGHERPGYVWCREQETAKGPHYHAALFLDGNKIRHPKKIRKMIDETWAAIRCGNTCWHPQRGHYFIDNLEEKRAAVERLSYLAKSRGKGYRPAQSKDYGSSRHAMPIEKKSLKTQARASDGLAQSKDRPKQSPPMRNQSFMVKIIPTGPQYSPPQAPNLPLTPLSIDKPVSLPVADSALYTAAVWPLVASRPKPSMRPDYFGVLKNE